MTNIYNLSDKTIGTMVNGVHIVIPAKVDGIPGSASVTEKQSEILINRYPKDLCRNYDDAKSASGNRNIKFQEEIAALKAENAKLKQQNLSLEDDNKKKDAEIADLSSAKKNLELKISDLVALKKGAKNESVSE